MAIWTRFLARSAIAARGPGRGTLLRWLPLSAGLALCAAAGCKIAGAAAGAGSAAPAPSTRPFGGHPRVIPGVIEAEDFDEGPHGVAYFDLDPENQGAPYRETSADIEARPDATGGYGIGWTRAGEWLVYTVEVAASGTYTLEIPAASPKIGGVFHLEVDGKDVTGPITAPDTGSWQKLGLIRLRGIRLEAGLRTLKVVMDREGPTGSIADLDHFRFTLEPSE